MRIECIWLVAVVALVVLTGCYYEPWESRTYESDALVDGGDSWETARHRVNGVAFSFQILSKYDNGCQHGPYTLGIQAHRLCEEDVRVDVERIDICRIGDDPIRVEVQNEMVFRKWRYAGKSRIYEYEEAVQGCKLPIELDPRDGKALIAEIHLVVRKRELRSGTFNAVPAKIKVRFKPKVSSGWFKTLSA